MPSLAPVVCFPTSGTHHPAFALLFNCAMVLLDKEVRVLDGKKGQTKRGQRSIILTGRELFTILCLHSICVCVCVCSVKAGCNHGSMLNSC